MVRYTSQGHNKAVKSSCLGIAQYVYHYGSPASPQPEGKALEALKFGWLSVEESENGIRFGISGSTPAEIKTDEVPTLLGFLKQHLEDSANRRSSWRLTLSTLGGTEADQLQVSVNGVKAKAIDISITGLFVETEEPIGERGDSLDVAVAFEDEAVSLRATIVRQDASMRRIAIHLPDCIDAQGTLCPPDSYQRIFTALEQIWLDKKLGLVWS